MQGAALGIHCKEFQAAGVNGSTRKFSVSVVEGKGLVGLWERFGG